MIVLYRQVNQHLKKLYPNVKRILWTTNIVRGGGKIMDQPTAPAPHLDYHQNDEERVQFHKEYPIFDSYVIDFNDNKAFNFSLVEPGILMGLQDTEESKLGVLLGVWKPLYPSKVNKYYFKKNRLQKKKLKSQMYAFFV